MIANERGVLWNQVIEGSMWKKVDTTISFSVGNRSRVRFWKDKRCSGSPFCPSFPSLFALLVSKKVCVLHIWYSMAKRG